MVLAGLRQLNVYGKVAMGSACLGLIVLLIVGGPPYPYEAVVLFGIAAVTVALAMYRNRPDEEKREYPTDRKSTRSERRNEREMEVEAGKGGGLQGDGT
ncbi:hypothetical protein ACFQMM_15980 [Saliphagus sp. GCM10025308]